MRWKINDYTFRLGCLEELASVGDFKYVLIYFLYCVKENAVHIAIAIFLTIARGYYASLSSIYLFISVVHVCFSFHCRFRFFLLFAQFLPNRACEGILAGVLFPRYGLYSGSPALFFLLQNYAISVIQQLF